MDSATNASDLLSLKGKRKKKIPVNANPLFTQWLNEWKIEAEEKGWKSSHTYAKALKTLKKFPITLETGRDCRLLQNFGEKICNMLDEKLLDYKRKNGIPSSSSFRTIIAVQENASVTKKNKPVEKKSKSFKEKNQMPAKSTVRLDIEESPLKNNNAPGCRALSGFHDISDGSDCDAPPPKKSLRQSSSESREYIPAYRSGPYALILTLFRHMQLPDFKGYMLKAELVHAAQLLADKSFTKPDPGKRYTAWSSVATLIRKGFILKVSSPAKYSLTDAGCELGKKLEEGENRLALGLDNYTKISNSSSQSAGSTLQKSSSLTSYSDVTLEFEHSHDDLPEIDNNDEVIISSDNELVDNFSDGEKYQPPAFHRPVCGLSPSSLGRFPNISPSPNHDRKIQSTDFGTKLNSEEIKTSSEILREEFLQISDDSDTDCISKPLSDFTKKQKKSFIEDIENELPDLDLPLSKRLLLAGGFTSGLLDSHVPKTQKSIIMKMVNIGNKNKLLSSHIIEKCAIRSLKETSETLPVNNENVPYAKHVFPLNQTDKISLVQDKIISKECVEPLTSLLALTTAEITPLFTLEPGAFDIILCIDNREFYGRTTSKTLLPELIKCGIHCDLRLLHAGDLLWIAREKMKSQVDRVEARELVLNYVIERKRMDDFVHSITEGRMKDQKVRLKQSGLSEPIILIEEYGSIQNFSISEERIKQTMVNSQIIDGFKVKICPSSDAAVIYIATMTRFLQQHFSAKTLHAITQDQLRQLRGQQHIERKEHYLIPFNVFNDSSVKQKDLTVKEMFMKHLFQIPGISADRAKAISNKYPTLSFLMEGYLKCKDVKEKEKLLSGIKTGKTERNLGITLSRLLSLLYTQLSSLS